MRSRLAALVIGSFVLAVPHLGRAQVAGAGSGDVIAAGTNTTAPALQLDFTEASELGKKLANLTGVAKRLAALAFILGLLIEAFAHGPGEPRKYGTVVWRTVVVSTLLVFYQPVFGTVLNVTQYLANEVGTQDNVLRAYWDTSQKLKAALEKAPAGAVAPLATQSAALPALPENRGTPGQNDANRITGGKDGAGGLVYDGLVALFGVLAEAVVFIVNWMSKILTGTFYLLGPIALVASIPRPSRTGSLWFKHLVTVACWPIFTGLLLTVLTALISQGVVESTGKSIEAVCAAGVLAFTAASAPKFASHVVGGGFETGAAMLTQAIHNVSKQTTSKSVEALTTKASAALAAVPVVGPVAAVAVNAVGRAAQHALGSARKPGAREGGTGGGGTTGSNPPSDRNGAERRARGEQWSRAGAGEGAKKSGGGAPPGGTSSVPTNPPGGPGTNEPPEAKKT
jgi:hypothetical protein